MGAKGKNTKRGGKKTPKSSKNVTKSTRAGTTFPVGRLNRMFRKGRYAQRTGVEAGVFLAGVFDYITYEILDLAVYIMKE